MVYGIFVKSPRDLPKGEHWAIIEGSSITIPGDERSRTHPGHGYPESTERYISYECFTDKAVFEEEFKRRLLKNRNADWKGIHVRGVYEINTEIILEEKQ